MQIGIECVCRFIQEAAGALRAAVGGAGGVGSSEPPKSLGCRLFSSKQAVGEGRRGSNGGAELASDSGRDGRWSAYSPTLMAALSRNSRGVP